MALQCGVVKESVALVILDVGVGLATNTAGDYQPLATQPGEGITIK